MAGSNNSTNSKTLQVNQKVEAISSNNSLSKTNTSVQVQANSKNKVASNLLTPITAVDMAGINSAGGQDGNSSKIMSQVAQALLFSGPAQSVQQNLLNPVTSATPIITASIVNSPPSAASLAGPGVTPSINQLLPSKGFINLFCLHVLHFWVELSNGLKLGLLFVTRFDYYFWQASWMLRD